MKNHISMDRKKKKVIFLFIRMFNDLNQKNFVTRNCLGIQFLYRTNPLEELEYVTENYCV